MQLLGKYLLDSSYGMRWLRRINRQTPTAFCSDVQRTCPRAKGQAGIRREWDWNRRIYFRKHAKRYRFTESGELVRLARNHCKDPRSDVKLVEDLSSLRCEYTFDQLFGSGCTLGATLRDPMQVFCWPASMEQDTSVRHLTFNYWVDLNRYLKELFGVPVYVSTAGHHMVTEQPRYKDTGICMHVTHLAGDQSAISQEENHNNHTIVFWLFEDRVVYCNASGISTW